HTPVEWLILKMRDLLHMQPATWLVSRALADAAGPWDETLTLDDDGEYAARLVAHSSGVHFVPDAWVYYRSRGHSLSTIDGTPAKLQSLYRAMCLQIQTLMALEDSERTREACAAYLIGWSPNFRRSSLAGDLVRAVRKFGATFQPPE